MKDLNLLGKDYFSQATCHREARDRVALEQARRDAEREHQRKLRR